jgi:putative NADPH-quinone reductase
MAGMTAIAFSCSPRGPKGSTGLVLGAFLEGFREGGGKFEVLEPYKMNIAPCKGCFSCWTKTPGRCAIEDDMTDVNRRLNEADAVVFATPVYHFTMSEGMKRLVERTMPLLDPAVKPGADGRAHHARIGRRDQRAVLISTCGFPELEVFDGLRRTFSDICHMMEWSVAGEILRTESGLLFSKDTRARESAAGYLMMVRKAGRTVAEGGIVEPQYRRYLEGDLLPRDDYYKLVNGWFAKKP